jgi:hypothetical protein
MSVTIGLRMEGLDCRCAYVHHPPRVHRIRFPQVAPNRWLSLLYRRLTLLLPKVAQHLAASFSFSHTWASCPPVPLLLSSAQPTANGSSPVTLRSTQTRTLVPPTWIDIVLPHVDSMSTRSPAPRLRACCVPGVYLLSNGQR